MVQTSDKSPFISPDGLVEDKDLLDCGMATRTVLVYGIQADNALAPHI